MDDRITKGKEKIAKLERQILRLESDKAIVIEENKRLAAELKHQEERHRLGMENLVLKVEAELREVERQSQSRFPILSKLLDQVEEWSSEAVTEPQTPPDLPDPPVE